MLIFLCFFFEQCKAVKTDKKLTLHNIRKIFSIELTGMKFKIWRVTFFKSFLPLKHFGMDFRCLCNRQFTTCTMRWEFRLCSHPVTSDNQRLVNAPPKVTKILCHIEIYIKLSASLEVTCAMVSTSLQSVVYFCHENHRHRCKSKPSEPCHDKTNKMACAPSEDSDQPGHPPSLIRVFAVRMKKAWVLSYPLSAQWRLWSDWADAQADLSLRWAHMPFC